MATAFLIGTLAFATIVVLIWTGIQIFQEQDDPVADRLAELQTNSAVATGRSAQQRRKGGGGFLNRFVYVISLLPGADGWIRDNEKKLARAGVRSKSAASIFVICCFVFLVLIMLGMAYLQRNNSPAQMLGGMAAASFFSWASIRGLLFAVPAGFLAAWPVNYWLLSRDLKACH